MKINNFLHCITITVVILLVFREIDGLGVDGQSGRKSLSFGNASEGIDSQEDYGIEISALKETIFELNEEIQKLKQQRIAMENISQRLESAKIDAHNDVIDSQIQQNADIEDSLNESPIEEMRSWYDSQYGVLANQDVERSISTILNEQMPLQKSSVNVITDYDCRHNTCKVDFSSNNYMDLMRVSQEFVRGFSGEMLMQEDTKNGVVTIYAKL